MAGNVPSMSALERRNAIEYAEALEADAEDSGERCDDLVEAAGYWRMAGDPDRERQALLTAIEADDGHSLFDARAAYGQFLMQQGETDAADELFTELLHENSLREQTYLCAAYAYQHAGQTRKALRWLNIGAQRILPDIAGLDLAGGDPGYELLSERRDLRRSMGEPLDAYDEFFEQAWRRGRDMLDAIHHIQHERDDPILYWPERDFAELRDCFPDQTHEDHRREVEFTALERSRTNVPVVVVSGSAAEYRSFASLRSSPAAETREEYAADLHQRGRIVAWPPERNQPCWCGSDRKYKKCCGSPGFAQG